MKRALVVALVVVLAFVGAGCGGDDGGDGGGDAGGRDDDEVREDPRSALIADQALLTATDLPPWWTEATVDPRFRDALLASTPACEGLSAAELTSGTNENARSGPVEFVETDGWRRLDLEISLYPNEADAEAFLTALEASDAPACVNALLADLVPGTITQPADWAAAPPLGDQSLALVISVAANEEIPEDGSLELIWVRVGRAVAHISYQGPTADDPTEYIETVATRLSEGLANT